MGNAELRMARLIASTLVLAGTAWVSSGSPAVKEQPVRQSAPHLEAAWNQHGLKALASLFAVDADFVSVAATQLHWGLSVETGPGQAATAVRPGVISLLEIQPNRPWLVASAHNANLLANPPPR